MSYSNRPMARLGLALTAAILGLTMATAIATADPTTSAPSSTETTSPSTPTETPTDPSTPPSSESSTPPESEPPAVAPEDVDVTATFDEQSYATGEDMAITLTVTNTGDEPMTMYAYFPHGATEDGIVVTATSTFKPDEKFTLAAGESVTNVLTGKAVDPKLTTGTLHVRVNAGEWRAFDFTVAVTPRTVPVSGIVFDDVNGNGSVDEGEGAGGGVLIWTSYDNTSYRESVWPNAAGEFSLDLSPGTYTVRGESNGFTIIPRTVVVPESGVDDVLIDALHRLSELTVDLEFAKDTYKPTDTPTLRVTLTNKGDRPLTDIVANCASGEDSPNLTGKDWGISTDGVLVPPRSTVVVLVTEAMPAKAHDYGYVAADCQFGHAAAPDAQSNPRDTDYATVPGKFADINVQIHYWDKEEDLSGWRLAIHSAEGCPIVAQAVTDKAGKLTIKHIPAGRYHIYMVPKQGWDFKGSWVPHAISSLVAGEHSYYYLAGTTSAPSHAPKPPDCPGGGTPPGPQGSAAPRLAQTGASLVLPGIAGLLAVLAGGGALLLTRRRKAT